MTTKEQAEDYILLKLLGKRFIGGKHTHKRNIPKGIPSQDIHLVEDALEALYRAGWINKKPTNDGIHVSLNPRVLCEVYNRLRAHGHVI